MPYTFHYVCFAVLLSFVAATSFAQDFRTVHPGIEYAATTIYLGEEPVKINLLRLDPDNVRIDVHHALDSAIGTEKLSSIARRRNAVAAINAGFFRFDTSIFAGDAAGILQIDGKLLSESSKGRVAVAITNGKDRTAVEFGHPATEAFITIGSGRFKIDGIDRERKSNDLILYTPEFFRTTLTDASGTEIAAGRCRRFERSVRCESAQVFGAAGSTKIPDGGFVISIGSDALERSKDLLGRIQRKSRDLRFTFALGSVSETFAAAEDITNGVPQLIKNGKIDITWEREGSSKAFAETRHPRTAIAKLSDGKILMITVDGRQPAVSVGMTLNELAEYLLRLGAADAINLDGGGSTTMYLDGKVVNSPSDKGNERKIGDAIVVSLRP